MKTKPENKIRLVKHLPRTWEKLTGITVYDPDGWRNDGKSFNIPITKEEWNRRMIVSTCMHRGGFLHGHAKIK